MLSEILDLIVLDIRSHLTNCFLFTLVVRKPPCHMICDNEDDHIALFGYFGSTVLIVELHIRSFR